MDELQELLKELDSFDQWQLWKHSAKVGSHPPQPEGYGCAVDQAGKGGGRSEGQATPEEAIKLAIRNIGSLP